MFKFVNVASIGDTVVYRPFLGDNRTVVLTAVLPDVKNARAGFDGTVINAGGTHSSVWGYADQIVCLVKADGSTYAPAGTGGAFIRVAGQGVNR